MKRFLLLALTAGLLSPIATNAHLTPEVIKGQERNFSEIALEQYLSAICRFKKANNSNGNEKTSTRIAKELSKKRVELYLFGNDWHHMRALPPKTINIILDLAWHGEEYDYLRELYIPGDPSLGSYFEN